ncbi:MAG: B12-binding domain-containing radical SAM protein [Ignavibacteria bacterium]|nr:B12-binding domain-containing radical SAM protein [Ignavibacteria bacterium]
MRSALFISFDIIRPGELNNSLALASILCFLKNEEKLLDKMNFYQLTLNIFDYEGRAQPNYFDKYLNAYNLVDFDFIAISAYIWNEYFINEFINHIRKLGFTGKIILGGYQITHADIKELPVLYPDTQIFVIGYAEQALMKLFLGQVSLKFPLFLYSEVDFSELPSPYLTNEINVPFGSTMIRLETKRGCVYRCSYCAHRNLAQNKIFHFPIDKTVNEISFISEKQVKRVNILDPIFNVGNEYLQIMKEIIKKNKSTTYTLQSRFEKIKGLEGNEFLDLCESGSFHLEFGLQTIDLKEAKVLNRKNDLRQIDETLNQLKHRKISYEISLIYGLPMQTFDSFKRTIEYTLSKGCRTIKAYPLILLRGTELFYERNKWNLNEEAIEKFNIPVVTSSNSFSKQNWEEMKNLSNRYSSFNN